MTRTCRLDDGIHRVVHPVDTCRQGTVSTTRPSPDDKKHLDRRLLIAARECIGVLTVCSACSRGQAPVGDTARHQPGREGEHAAWVPLEKCHAPKMDLHPMLQVIVTLSH
jgi:hypothetical protein